MQIDSFDQKWLLSAIRSGLQPKYVFFWGHTGKHEGPVGRECLSQWYPASFSVNGQAFPTAEHFMMACKAQLFDDQEIYERILAAPTPGVVKGLGREVRGFEDERWKAACWDIVVRGNWEKFAQNPELCDLLLGTGNCVLVEASPLDRVWRIGLSGDDPRASNPELWEGANILGFALMEVRRRLLGTDS